MCEQTDGPFEQHVHSWFNQIYQIQFDACLIVNGGCIPFLPSPKLTEITDSTHRISALPKIPIYSQNVYLEVGLLHLSFYPNVSFGNDVPLERVVPITNAKVLCPVGASCHFQKFAVSISTGFSREDGSI